MKKDRKNIILQSLASMLEERNLAKITTALLAEKSNITEAALYRHFPSKRAIYAELFSFVTMLFLVSVMNLKKVNYLEETRLKMHICFL